MVLYAGSEEAWNEVSFGDDIALQSAQLYVNAENGKGDKVKALNAESHLGFWIVIIVLGVTQAAVITYIVLDKMGYTLVLKTKKAKKAAEEPETPEEPTAQ